ncbi:MAG: MFS transporter [Promethearchaeota archaeon]
MIPTPPIKEQASLTEPSVLHRAYRFWPVYAMSFLRTFFFAIYSIALPNYLIFEKQFSSSLVGAVGSVSAIAYIFGPYFGRKVTDKIGIKQTLVLSHTISAISIFFSIFTTNPVVLIIMRAVDGFINGFFWINILNLIATWEVTCERISEKEKHQNFLSTFNYSWNFGLIGGFLVGYGLVLLLGSDYVALIISAIFASFLIPSAFLLESSDEFELHENQAVVFQDLKLRTKPSSYSPPVQTADVKLPDGKESLKHVPILMAWGGILLYASTKSILKFTLPYFIKLEDMNSEWVYLIVLFQQVFQITGLTVVRKMDKMRYGYFSAMGILLVFTFSFFFSPSILVIALINIIAGFWVGLIQGVTQRIVLDHGKASGSRKYTMINEIIMGISFGVVPFIAGFLNEFNIIYDFIFLALEISLLAIILIFTHWKFSNNQE